MDSGISSVDAATVKAGSDRQYTPVDANCPLDGTQLRLGEGAAKYYQCPDCLATYCSTKPEELDKRAQDYVQRLRERREQRLAELGWLDRIIESAENKGY